MPRRDDSEAAAAKDDAPVVIGRRDGGRRMVDEAADLEDDLVLLREPLEQLAERSQRIGEIYDYETKNRTFGLPRVNANEDSMLEAKLMGLQELVQYNISHSSAYFRFFLTFFFFAVYTQTLFMQRDITLASGLELPLLSKLLDGLPLNGKGGYFNDGYSASGWVSSIDQFYRWFDSNLITTTFQDPVCGDGTCDDPSEFPGFGRFGCAKDCGRYAKTSTLEVDLHTYVHSAPAGWDISGFPYEKSPNFKYNIFSHTMQEFLWKEDQDAATHPTAKVEVPDGKLTLHLYQGQKLWTGDKDAPSDLRMNAESFPEQNRSTARYGYGDAAEVLEFARLVTRTLEDACWETASSISSAAAGCDQFDWWDTYTRALGGYGLAGTISLSAGRARRKELLADVAFCGVIENGIDGVDVPANKKQLQDAAEACAPAPAPAALVPLAAGVAPSTTSGREGVCISHHNCSSGLFCSNWFHKTGAGQSGSRRTGWSGLGAGVCQPCRLCRVDSEDAWSAGPVAGSCPQDKCTGSGGLPACMSSQKLVSALTCADQYHFEIRKYHAAGTPVRVKPDSAKHAVRFIAPHNRLVGAIVLTQERQHENECVPPLEGAPRGIAASLGWQRINPSLANYTRAAVGNVRCPAQSRALDGSPMGMDPVFMPSSVLFDGHLQAGNYYGLNERSTNASNFIPLLFYPHSYDQAARAPKPETQVMAAQRDQFKVYFDERLTQAQARRLLTALRDGKFYEDGLTQRLNLELVSS